jgi:hypothetical protein
MIKQEIVDKFFTNTDETGRFVVTSKRTGRSYFVEPMGDPHIKWGSVDPATKELVNKKGAGKYRGAIDEKDSLITEENGFKNIRVLPPGTSPLMAIEAIDDKYPDKSE